MKSPAPKQRRRPRAGTILNFTLAGLAMGALLWAGFESSGSLRRHRRLDPITPTEVGVALRHAGLGPEQLAAAGLSPAQAAAVVAQARGYVVTNAQTLRDQEAAWNTSRAEVERLERLVRAGRSSVEDRAALQLARTQLAAARAGREASLNALHEAGVAELAIPQRATLGVMRQNENWSLPTQYLAVDRPDDEWVGLRSALADDRFATRTGSNPDPVFHEHLLTWNAQAAVAAAAAGLTNNLGEVTSTWNQGLQP